MNEAHLRDVGLISKPESGLLIWMAASARWVRCATRSTRSRLGLSALGALSLAVSACNDAQRVEISPPESVTFLGAVTVNSRDDAHLASTTLLPRGKPLELSANDAATTWVLGYDEPSLLLLRENAARLGLDFEALVGSSPLFLSTGCEAELPRAAWAMRAEGGEDGEEIEPAQAPNFRASWVDSLCLELPPEPSADAPWARSWSIESEVSYCPRSSLVTQGCAVRFDAQRCGASQTDALEFHTNPDGRACFNGAACVDRSRANETPSGQRLDFECVEAESTNRRYVVHAKDWSDEDAFADIDWVRIMDEDVVPTPTGELSRTIQFAAWVSSITRLGAEILFTTHPAGPAGYRCDAPSPTKLVFVDAETMNRARTTTTTPCLTKVIADGTGGFHAVARPELGRFTSARYDAVGLRLDEQRLLEIEASSLRWEHWPSALLEVPSGYLLVVSTGYLTEAQEERPGPSEIRMVWLDEQFRIERLSSAPIPTDPVFVGTVSRVETLNGPRLVYLEDYADLILLADLETGEIESFSGLGRSFGSAYRVLEIVSVSPASLAVSVEGTAPVVAEVRLASDGDIELGRRAIFHELPADVSSIVKLPSGEVMASAVIRSSDSSEAVWARFDPVNWRFRPGSLRLLTPDGGEPGPVTGSLIDPAGRVWLAFAHSAWAARLTLR